MKKAHKYDPPSESFWAVVEGEDVVTSKGGHCLIFDARSKARKAATGKGEKAVRIYVDWTGLNV